MPRQLGCAVIWLGCMTLISGCETVPVAVPFPKPAEPPEVLLEPASTQPPLIERYKLLMQELQDSLRKAIVQ